MRKAVVALSLSALALSGFALLSSASAAPVKLSKMGCIIGKQKWDAPSGKCVAAKPVAKAKTTKKPVVKKAI